MEGGNNINDFQPYRYEDKIAIWQNYGQFAKQLRSVIISQNHYLNKILDVHPLQEKSSKDKPVFLKLLIVL